MGAFESLWMAWVFSQTQCPCSTCCPLPPSLPLAPLLSSFWLAPEHLWAPGTSLEPQEALRAFGSLWQPSASLGPKEALGTFRSLHSGPCSPCPLAPLAPLLPLPFLLPSPLCLKRGGGDPKTYYGHHHLCWGKGGKWGVRG